MGDDTETATPTATPQTVFDLDVPVIDAFDPAADHDDQTARTRQLAADHWIVRNPIGFSILGYDDVTAILRDKRWHNVAAKIPEMMGITDPDFLENRRVSILSRRGRRPHPAAAARRQGVLAAVRRPAAPVHARGDQRAGRPVSLDRPGRRSSVDICEPYPIPIICELLGAPKEDWQLFSRWAEDVLRIFNGTVSTNST